MTHREENLKKIANASGFPFQLAIEHEVRTNEGNHNWEVMAHEYPWCDPENPAEGYIDLVLKKNRNRMVIECKRLREGTWIFLNPNKKKRQTQRARLFWSRIEFEERIKISGERYTTPNYFMGYSEFLSGETPESEFCSIRGSGEDGKPFLEHIAGNLLTSVESLAHEELGLKKSDTSVIYIPAVITNAELVLCNFEPDKIPLSDALISEAEFETVPMIKFRKSLSTKLTENSNPQQLIDIGKNKERTIFVINAESLTDVLKNINIERDGEFWPWNYKTVA